MAAFAGTFVSVRPRPRLLRQSLATTSISSLKSLSFSNRGGRLTSQHLPLCLRVSCAGAYGRHRKKYIYVFNLRQVTKPPQQPERKIGAGLAKPETVEKVCAIVKKQLALPEDSAITGESKFAALGADSLDTVEIVMGLEEEFGINVEEESAQSIATVQDAADLIEKLIEKKDA